MITWLIGGMLIGAALAAAATVVATFLLRRWMRWAASGADALQMVAAPALNEKELEQVFRVPEDERWFVAVLEVIEGYERETVDASRKMVGVNTEMCMSSVSNGEAAAQIAARLRRMRAVAVAGVEGKK